MATKTKSRKIPVTNPFSEIPKYLSDEQAERIGRAIAQDFGLQRSTEQLNGWETESGWFSNKGIARRAHRHIVEGL